MLITFVCIAMSGCGGTPYLEVGLSHQINEHSDWYVRTHRQWQCTDNLKFDGEIGVEWDNNWKLGYRHQSWVLCGRPFNNDPELYADDIRLSKKWGGK